MDKQTASHILAEKCVELRKLFNECMLISDASGVIFTPPWGGEGSCEAGLGGDYVPENSDNLSYYDRSGWNASAHTC